VKQLSSLTIGRFRIEKGIGQGGIEKALSKPPANCFVNGAAFVRALKTPYPGTAAGRVATAAMASSAMASVWKKPLLCSTMAM